MLAKHQLQQSAAARLPRSPHHCSGMVLPSTLHSRISAASQGSMHSNGVLSSKTPWHSSSSSNSSSSSSSRQCSLAGAVRSSAAAASSDGDDADIPPEAKVYLEKKDIGLSELLRYVEKGELDLQPEYQRGLVWDRKMASRLVVTALEKRVVPAVFLEETEGGRYKIMDGKQRLTSLLTFIAGRQDIGDINWHNAPVELDLKEDSCDPRWQGKRFVDLPEDRQRKLERYSLYCVIVKENTDRDVVFNIYLDINTGSVSHTDQQGRKAAYHGTYVSLLDGLAANRDFLAIQGRDAPDSEKEADRELALRFFAMLRSADRYKVPLCRFLNQELKQYQNADEQEIERLRGLFVKTAAVVWQVFGRLACRQPKPLSHPRSASSSSAAVNGASSSKPGAAAQQHEKLNPALFDATMVAVCQELESNKRRRQELVNAAGAIRQAYVQLFSSNKEFRAVLDNRSRQKVLARIEMMRRMLQTAAPPIARDQQRAFSQDIKRQLWEAVPEPPLCGLCQQVIHTLGDAEVDHVVPWSHGGSTSIDNAQLVHSYCNRFKGNRTAATADDASSSSIVPTMMVPAAAADTD